MITAELSEGGRPNRKGTISLFFGLNLSGIINRPWSVDLSGLRGIKMQSLDMYEGARICRALNVIGSIFKSILHFKGSQ